MITVRGARGLSKVWRALIEIENQSIQQGNLEEAGRFSGKARRNPKRAAQRSHLAPVRIRIIWCSLSTTFDNHRSHLLQHQQLLRCRPSLQTGQKGRENQNSVPLWNSRESLTKRANHIMRHPQAS